MRLIFITMLFSLSGCTHFQTAESRLSDCLKNQPQEYCYAIYHEAKATQRNNQAAAASIIMGTPPPAQQTNKVVCVETVPGIKQCNNR